MKNLFRALICILCPACFAVIAGEAPLPEVGVAMLKAESVPITAELNGRAVASVIAEVRPQVNGIIQKRLFDEGSNVEAGVQLYQIDPAMYEAQLVSAQAELAKAQANVDVTKAKKDRYDDLIEQKAVSHQDYDEVFAAWKQAEAEIGIAEAKVKIAQINVDYTKVLSPIAGRIGKSGVTQGALVTANQVDPLATIHHLDPIYVDISQSSVGLLRLKAVTHQGKLSNTGESHGAVRLVLEDGTPYPHEGKILFSEVTVDQSTGTVSLRAEFPNPNWVLLPGMYLKATIDVGRIDGAVTVPQQALMRNADGSAMVYVVQGDGTVERRTVKTSRAVKDKWLIDEGLRDGEQVIVEGIQRVRFVAGSPDPKVNPVEIAPEQ